MITTIFIVLLRRVDRKIKKKIYIYIFNSIDMLCEIRRREKRILELVLVVVE